MIDTAVATLERRGDIVSVRFKPDAHLNLEEMARVVRAKHELCDTEPADILVVLPSEMDFDLTVLAVDHHSAHGGCGLSRRLALAASSPFHERLAHIYFRYHPREHETAVFLEESEALAWLQASQPGLS